MTLNAYVSKKKKKEWLEADELSIQLKEFEKGPSIVARSCPTLCDPTDCSPSGSAVHGMRQARILEWVAVTSSRRSSWLRD